MKSRCFRASADVRISAPNNARRAFSNGLSVRLSGFRAQAGPPDEFFKRRHGLLMTAFTIPVARFAVFRHLADTPPYQEALRQTDNQGNNRISEG